MEQHLRIEKISTVKIEPTDENYNSTESTKSLIIEKVDTHADGNEFDNDGNCHNFDAKTIKKEETNTQHPADKIILNTKKDYLNFLDAYGGKNSMQVRRIGFFHTCLIFIFEKGFLCLVFQKQLH